MGGLEGTGHQALEAMSPEEQPQFIKKDSKRSIKRRRKTKKKENKKSKKKKNKSKKPKGKVSSQNKQKNANPLLSRLIEEVFDGAAIICYEERCDKHRPGGGTWSEKAQHKIAIFNGADSDAQFNMTTKDHTIKTTMTHLTAMGHAEEKRWGNV